MTGRYSTEAIARVCHAANTELQRLADGPAPSVPWDSETEEIRQSAIAGVEAALKGVSPEELHAEWCRTKAAQGYRRGEFKSEENRTHPCLIPYADLPESERVKDAVFGAVVRAMTGGETSSFTEWAVFWGGEHPDDCAGLLTYDDEEEATEMVRWISGAGVTKRTMTRGPWTVTQAAVPDPDDDDGILEDAAGMDDLEPLPGLARGAESAP